MEVEAGGFESHPATRLAGRTQRGMVAAAAEVGLLQNQGTGGRRGGPEAGSAWLRGRSGELAIWWFHVAFYYILVYVIFIKEHGSQLRSLLKSAYVNKMICEEMLGDFC